MRCPWEPGSARLSVPTRLAVLFEMGAAAIPAILVLQRLRAGYVNTALGAAHHGQRRLGGLLVGALAHDSAPEDRKSTRLNSSHVTISYAVFCLKKKKDERTGGRQSEFLQIER